MPHTKEKKIIGSHSHRDIPRHFPTGAMFAVSRKLIASKVAVATTRTAVRNFALAVRYHKHGDPEDVYK